MTNPSASKQRRDFGYGSVKLAPSWLAGLSAEFDQPYMVKLSAFLAAEKAVGKVIYPAGEDMFNAFNYTSLEQVRVVILGQDPYHGPEQAHGLCFSVKPGVPVPPSLRNIYKEIHAELGLTMPAHGCLNSWAQQGVLLLNSVLSVEQGLAASHQGQGWEQFTDRAIELVNREAEAVVFMLWGGYAQRKGSIIDEQRHCVLRAPHPSPLSAHRGFFGCGHFRQANDYLLAQGRGTIDWSLPARPDQDSRE
jgi:uracil-DNA glycosylase